MAGTTGDNPRGPGTAAVFTLCMVTGTLMAFSVSAGVRLYRGHPPGVTPKPYAELLGRQLDALALPGLDGGNVFLPQGGVVGRHVLYFTDSGCGACDRAYPLLSPWPKEVPDVPIVIVATGAIDSVRAKLVRHGITTATAFDSSRQALTTYGIHGLPSALLVDEGGRVVSGAVGSAALTQIRQVLAKQ